MANELELLVIKMIINFGLAVKNLNANNSRLARLLVSKKAH